jgi:cobalt-zinc-cadmium efflux system outer membrane protein
MDRGKISPLSALLLGSVTDSYPKQIRPLPKKSVWFMASRVSIAKVLVTLSLLAGCATFHAKPLSPAQTVSTFESRSLNDPQLREFLEKRLRHEIAPWPPKSWDFAMLSLAAFYYHPDLDVARAEWEVAKAGVITAGAIPNPSMDFTPQYDTPSPAGVPPWTLGLILDIPIETAGKRGYRIARAKHLFEAAALNMATVAWRVRSRLRASLLNLYAPDQLAANLRKEISIQEALVKLMGKRLAVGEVSRPDVTLAHISLDQTRLSLEEAQKQKAQAQVQLANALGLPVAALDEATISFAFVDRLPAEPPLTALRSRALLNRPDILGALSEYAASQSTLQLEIAKQYPDIQLGPGYQYDQGENKWSIGISLTLPVFNQNQGPIAEAEARRKQAESRFTALQARVIGEIDRALAGYKAALKKLNVADSLLVDKQRRLQSTQEMFHVGETDRLSLLSGELELATATILRLNALVEAQHSLGLLEDALQYPLHPLESFPAIPEMNPGMKDGGENR